MSAFKRPRFIFVVIFLLIVIISLLARVFDLTELKQAFLRGHGQHESIHYQLIPSIRGMIYDRNGVPLAVSAPVDNIVLDAKQFNQKRLKNLNKLLTQNSPILDRNFIENFTEKHPHSQFYYLEKNVAPSVANRVTDLRIPGLYAELKQKSFYPQGAAMAQLIGFTNHQNIGQDGLELSLNNRLAGTPGEAEFLTNAHRHDLHILKTIKAAHAGHNVTLSIDSRIQAIAYEALKKEVTSTQAKSGSVVVIQPQTGEVLTAVSYPSFNPNDVNDRTGLKVKDRAITDQFEPGSTVKVLTLGTGLESGKYTPQTIVDTSPGYFFVDGNRVRDDSDFGALTLTGILTKSSNVGASKVALSLPHQDVYNTFIKAGFGQLPTTQFPGAAMGVIHPLATVGNFEYATMSFGYAVSASLLQLAKFYGAIANKGIMMPLSFIKLKTPLQGSRLFTAKAAQQLIGMLHTVVGPHGTGILANIPGYNVAGKTGTSHQVGPHGFYHNRFNAVFIGLAPLKDPKLIVAVRINDPRGHFNAYGGVSAAPVFAKVMEAGLEYLNVPPTKAKVDTDFFKKQHQFFERIIHA